MICMEKLHRTDWLLVFVFMLALGIVLHDTHMSDSIIARYSSALAPTPDAVYQTEESMSETASDVSEDTAENSEDESGTSANSADTAQGSAVVININTAPREVLVGLDGIGDKMAQRIITYRTEHGPFETIQDIMKVNGIGDKKFEKIKSRITVN